MKYFKFTQISAESGISWKIEQPISGPSYPFTLLPGLTNIIQLSYDNMFYIGEADDSATENPSNFIFQLTFEERAQELYQHIEFIRQQSLARIYDDENLFRRETFKYDSSASLAGLYKYEEAKQLVLDNNSTASVIRMEAQVRGMDPVILAQRIITNHEDFRQIDAKIAGIRGLILDRINAFSFDLENPDISLNEYFSKEKIGEELVPSRSYGEENYVMRDVMIGKYDLALNYRYKYFT